jgi:5'-nucleotidase
MQNRRDFIKKCGIATGLVFSGNFPFQSLADSSIIKLTILYTNDTQSQLEPFGPEMPKYAGMGGIQSRADLIQKIRAEEKNVLLLDAGDFFQASPYFDTFKGGLEVEAMNKMKYDAACIGEHEFDGGAENLARQLSKASFAILCSNYQFMNKDLQSKIKAWNIIEKEGIKIGITGIGLDLKSLISEDLDKEIIYYDAIKSANETATHLKKKENCDFIICLSHLGLMDNESNVISDKILAKESEYIDLIIGGHSHTLLNKPMKFFNKKRQEILVTQAGWGGTHLGRIDYSFSTKKNILSSNAQTVEIVK